ncbi:MAG: TonB-dependent receptor, partial [Calditrichaeota bacterium]|nr:TonB-dependent receptor [Calditrichota bacterium]
KLHFNPLSAVKIVLSGLYGKTETSSQGNSWGDQVAMNYGYDVVGSALGRNKYYLAANDLLDVWTKQLGAKITHTLSPSTFYEIRYDYFSTDTKAGRAAERNPAIVKTIAGVGFDEAPRGWVGEAVSLTDLTGNFDFFGGGRVSDTSFVKSQRLNFDLTSQINNQNMIKLGFEYGADHVKRNNRKAGTIILKADAGNFLRYDRTPTHYAGYIQDKIEYGGMIANIGLRVEHYNANGYIYDPGNLYSMLWARGGTAGYARPDDLPKEKSKAYTYIAPRVAFSHPVRENTKFFFNYGVYYSEPTNRDRFGLFSESWDFGNPQGDIRFVGYSNLEAPRTSAYEVGFEQSIGDEWLLRSYFYSKDNTDQIGGISVNGMNGSHDIGEFRNYEGVGKGAAGYRTRRNNNWQDIRGIEFKVTKMRGQYFTGWLNMDYLISTSGNYGLQRYNQDPLVAYYAYSAVKQQPQSQPSFIANLDFHTPVDWGKMKGDWRLSVLQRWAKGTKVIYNPTGLPTREVRTIYYWINNYTTTLRLNKTFALQANLKVRLYMDVNNLFNFRHLNVGVLNSAERDIYYNQYVDKDNGLDKKIGEYKDKNGNNVFTENWIDKNGTKRAPIAPSKDFALFYNPRSLLFGVKFEF